MASEPAEIWVLQNCPFCGAGAAVIRNPLDFAPMACAHVRCAGCGARTAPCYAPTMTIACRRAASLWNQRLESAGGPTAGEHTGAPA